MTVAIRPIDDTDHDAILVLSMRAWGPVFDKLQPAVPSFVYNAFWPNGWEIRQYDEIAALLKTDPQHIWVACECDVIVGWIGIKLHPEDKMGEIYILATDPDHQKKGIGKALMQVAFDYIRIAGFSMVMVETGDDNGHAPSRATYESVGFERWPVARYFKKL